MQQWVTQDTKTMFYIAVAIIAEFTEARHEINETQAGREQQQSLTYGRDHNINVGDLGRLNMSCVPGMLCSAVEPAVIEGVEKLWVFVKTCPFEVL